MRMWMIDPKLMCDQHLLGEHVELHMLVGSIKRKKSISGFLDKKLLEPMAIKSRHAALVQEMEKRGMNHKSPLKEFDIGYLSIRAATKVDINKSILDLEKRCQDCRKKIKEFV